MEQHCVQCAQRYVVNVMKCVICGKPTAPLSDRFCSPKCREIYINRVRREDALAGRIVKLDSLDEKLKYCKENGITYAEYQALRTLGKL